MTDEQKSPQDEIEATAAESNESLSTDDIDVEGALAALATLHELTRDEKTAPSKVSDEAPEIGEFERIDSDEREILRTDEIAIASSESPTVYDTAFPRPVMSALHRGQLASVVPALLLIGIGGYLTFVLTTSASPIEPVLIIGVLAAGIAAMLLAQWLSSSRWAMGNFFIAIILFLVGGTAAYLLIANNPSFVQGWPLLITALGTSFVLTDLFVPSGRRIWFVGLVSAIAGLAGLLVTMNLIPVEISQIIANLWPVALILSLLVLIAPFFRRRSQ